MHALVLSLLALLVAAEVSLAAAPTTASAARRTAPLVRLDPELFPLPPELRDNVDLWTDVYSRYDSNTVLFHDNLYVDIRYAVLDFSEVNEGSSAGRARQLRRQHLDKTKAKYRSILNDLAAGRVSKSWPDDARRVQGMFADVPGGRSKYRAAIDRFRTQTCLRDRFADGIRRSGLYLPTFERIFAGYDLPKELTRLPFVESMFVEGARSKVAAGGIWQFMPATGRSYLRITETTDERFDPMKAADAAARMLGDNYAMLGTWPLALTGYNHGPNGMRRAVKQLGTRDLGTIVRRYQSRTFGYASRNFYAEFYAAATIYANREHYFPGVEPEGSLEFDEFVPDQYVSIPALASAAGLETDAVRRLNPGLARSLWSAELYLPRGYTLRVPQGALAKVETAYAGLAERSSSQIGRSYRVRRGDTLSKIARRNGTTTRAIQRRNNLRSTTIRVGQVLKIPSGSGAVARSTTPRVSSGSSRASSHTVRRGDTLGKIAARYGTSVSALRRTNGMRSDVVRIGQRLKIPSGETRTHIVRSGDTLTSIARRYGTSVRALQRANNIRGHVIRPSQMLVIP